MSLQIPGITLPQVDLGNEPIIGPLVRPIEGLLSSLGMNSPSRRLVGVSIITGAALWATKPSRFFEGGKPRPWSLWNFDELNTMPVAIPWWMASVLAGTAAGVFL